MPAVIIIIIVSSRRIMIMVVVVECYACSPAAVGSSARSHSKVVMSVLFGAYDVLLISHKFSQTPLISTRCGFAAENCKQMKNQACM